MASLQKQLNRIVREYRLAGGSWPAAANSIADWAIANRKWEPHPMAARRQCAREIARSMRDETIIDAKGRRVRAKHPVSIREGGEQTVLWDDIRTASRSHMELSLQQRRNRIVGDCRQLSIDADSFNETRSPEEPIQIVFDFSRDVEELRAAEAA